MGTETCHFSDSRRCVQTSWSDVAMFGWMLIAERRILHASVFHASTFRAVILIHT